MSVDRKIVPVVKQERAQATVALLLEATIDALEAHGESGVRLDDILDTTGVSRSSLYHHFGDRDGLIDAARLVMFTRAVDSDLVDLERAIDRAQSAEAFRASIEQMNTAVQSPKRQPGRLRRAYTLGATKTRPQLAEALASEQRRLTERYTMLIQAAQVRGWVRRDLDASAVAVYLQAVTLGRIVSDIDTRPVDPGSWRDLIWHVLESSILSDDSGSGDGA